MLKIVAIAIVCGIIIIYLKNLNSELVPLVILASGIIIIFLGLNYLISSFEFINEIIEKSQIDNQIINIIFKITAVGYVIEFGADAVEEFGLKSLSNKLVFVGKLIIFVLSIPIINAVFDMVLSLF